MLPGILYRLIGAAMLVASQPAVTTLKPANGALTERFEVHPLDANPRGFREFGDGRVLLVDGRRTLVADFAAGTVQLRPNLRLGPLASLDGDTTISLLSTGWEFLVRDEPVGMLPETVVARLVKSRR